MCQAFACECIRMNESDRARVMNTNHSSMMHMLKDKAQKELGTLTIAKSCCIQTLAVSVMAVSSTA